MRNAVYRDVVKWLEKRCKSANRVVEELPANNWVNGGYADGHTDGYAAGYAAACVHIKKSVEKYFKKLEHEEEEHATT